MSSSRDSGELSEPLSSRVSFLDSNEGRVGYSTFDFEERKKFREARQTVTKTDGLTVVGAIFFIIGEMAGSGILALPKAFSNAGWIGIPMLIICCAIAGYEGVKLGKAWQFILYKFPDLREVRDPYPVIARESMGPFMEKVVKVCVYITLFSVSLVLLILSADNIYNFIAFLTDKPVPFCGIILIVGFLLAPFGFFSTPSDMPWVAYTASASTFIACIFIISQTAIEGKDHEWNSTYLENNLDECSPPRPVFVSPCVTSVASAFGKILFCYGGMSVFPTIQTDMKRPQKFSTVVIVSLTAILLMMLPVSIAGYAVYGSDVENNILDQLDNHSLMTQTANVLITLHLLFAFAIVQNPLHQGAEAALGLDPVSQKKKCIAVRLSIMVIVILTALLIPDFGVILDLVGSTTVTLNTFIFPSLFYMSLVRKYKGELKVSNHEDAETVSIGKPEYVLHIIIMIIGIIGGVISGKKAISSGFEMKPPCFKNFFISPGHVSH